MSLHNGGVWSPHTTSYPSPTYTQKKTTTTVYEYDEDGKVTKQTVTEDWVPYTYPYTFWNTNYPAIYPTWTTSTTSAGATH